MKPIIITVERNERKYTIELPWDADIHEICEAYRGLLYLMTFSAKLIDEVIPEQE